MSLSNQRERALISVRVSSNSVNSLSNTPASWQTQRWVKGCLLAGSCALGCTTTMIAAVLVVALVFCSWCEANERASETELTVMVWWWFFARCSSGGMASHL